MIVRPLARARGVAHVLRPGLGNAPTSRCSEAGGVVEKIQAMVAEDDGRIKGQARVGNR
jgi:hypothetical protein